MKYSLSILSFLLAFTALGQSPDSTLSSLSQKINFEFGSAFYYNNGWDKTEYEDHFLDNFTHLTPESGMVWGEYLVSVDSADINFWGGDRLIGFAHNNDMPVKAQHLVWHHYFAGADVLLPDWLVTDDGIAQYPKEELSILLENFIIQTVHHYTDSFPETIKWWSVVNEAGSNSTGYIPNLWLDSLGSAYIDSSFVWARAAAGPDIKLYYNEYFYHGAPYGGARIQSKIDFAYDVVSGLVERGVPIDGMGFQSHIPAIGYPGKAVVAADMKRFTDLGLEVYITELDVELIAPITQEKLEQQALIYKEMVEIALENPLIKLVCLWQFNDAQSWLGAESESLIMDENYNPKLAYDSIQSVLIAAGGLVEPITSVSSISVNGASDVTTITITGGTLQMEATVLPSDATDNSVTWSVTGGTASATIDANGLLTASTSGTVTVKATAADGSSINETITITISNQIVLVSSLSVQGENGVATITTNGGMLQMEATVLPADATDNSVTWSVTDGTGSATIDENGLLTASTNGTVTVTVIAADGSVIDGAIEITISNQITLGVTNSSLTNNFNIYPNPVIDEINIESLGLKIVAINIIDINGKLINFVPFDGIINISNLEKGVYILQIQYENNLINKRFIKE